MLKTSRKAIRTQMRAVLSTEPVASTQSLYLFQSQLRISYLAQPTQTSECNAQPPNKAQHSDGTHWCAGMVMVENGARASQTLAVQSPEAVAKTSGAAGFHAAA